MRQTQRHVRGQTRFDACRERTASTDPDALCSGAPWFPDRLAMGIKAALPKYEIYIYNTVLCLAVLWSASWISEVSSCEYGGEAGRVRGRSIHKRS